MIKMKTANEALERYEGLRVRIMERAATVTAGKSGWGSDRSFRDGAGAMLQALLQEIPSDLPEPVDPDLVEAIDQLSHSFVPQTDEARDLVLRCIKRGRALERGEN